MAGHPEEEQEASVEAAFAGQPPPAWWRQVTVRAVAASVVLGGVFSFMSMRMGLTVGLVPSFNMSASLVSFFAISSWTRLMARCGVATRPFTRQENVVVQTCVIACATLSLYGGFTSFLLAMTETVARSAGAGGEVHALRPGKVIAFQFLVGFSSLFITLPLRKIMIVDYKLMYPTGSAIAGIVNSLHTPKGAATAKSLLSPSSKSSSVWFRRLNRESHSRVQARALLRTLAASFSWAAFQWLYTAGDGCGFQAFPLFGLKAYKERFYFDFSPSLVGVGMLCPFLVNLSLLVGAVVSSGIMVPLLRAQQGKWFTDPSPASFRGLNGYQVPMGISMVLGDCLFQLSAIGIRAARRLRQAASDADEPSYDSRRRLQTFQSDDMPTHAALAGYVALAAISSVFVPRIFPPIRYYHVALCYAIAPLLAFCNSYAAGLTDWSLGSVYGKLALFIVGAWVGGGSGGQVAGLAACGIVVVVIGNSGELMHDFKTAYLTLTSPLSMFASQVIGTTIGCLVNPSIFFAFQKLVGTDHLGEAGSLYAAPIAVAYRGIAVLSVHGIKTLPRHSIPLCFAGFVVALCINCLTAIAGAKNWRVKAYIPNIMAMTIPFFVGPTFAVDMFLGSLILIVWKRVDRKAANVLSIVVASGLICGDGLWALPSAFLAIFKVQPPICMKFLSSYQSDKIQQHFLPDLPTP